MYGRPVDDNEMRYLRAMWSELRFASRILTFGFAFGCLGGLVIAGLSVLLAQKDHDVGGIIGSGLIGIMGLGLTGLFGFLFLMSLRAARQAFPARLVVEDIEGPFRIQSTRSRPFSWLGDNLVTIPSHWRRPIERAGANRIFQAEAVDGPGAEMIVLTLGDKLSVSRDVERGLLAVVRWGTLVAALFALAALIISGIPFMIFSQEELTLPRYLAAGHNLALFASAAELQKTPPPPYTRVELRNVTLACTPNAHIVAVDDIPDALLAEGGPLRAEVEPLLPAYAEFEHDVSNPHTKTSLDAVKGDPRMPELVAKVAALKKLMKNPELSEATRQVWRAPRLLFASMLAARAKLTFVKAKTWTARIAADAATRGVRVTGVPDDARTACRALDAVTFYAKGDPTIEATDALERLLNGFDAAVRDLPMAFRSRPVVRGVVHSIPGGVAIAIDESYSTAVLLVQAAAACLAGLTGILILASIVTLARRAPIARRLEAAMPDVA